MRLGVDLTKARILIVDDDRRLLPAFAGLLRQAGALVTAVSSGKEALDAYDADVFDVVVTDLAMPGMDGVALLGELRRRETQHGSHVPVILMSAEAPRDLKGVHGFVDYLSKPFGIADLIAVIARASAAGRGAET